MTAAGSAAWTALSAMAATEWPMLLLKMTLWLALAWVGHALLGRAHPSWRVRLWRVAVLGLVVLPAASVWAPRVDVAFEAAKASVRTAPRSNAKPSTETAPPAQSATRPPVPLRQETWMGAEAEAKEGFRMITGRRWRDARSAVVALWLVGIGCAILRLVAGAFAGHLVMRASLPAPDSLERQCLSVCHALGVKRRLRIRISDSLASPVLAGLLRPVLLLPARLTGDAHADDLPGVLAHEIAHLKSRDLGWNAVVRLVAAILWFHPLARRMPGAHSAACEEACDAAAARHTGDVLAYRRTLARIAVALHARRTLAIGLPMARTSEIGRRVDALARLRQSPATGRAVTWVVAVAFLAALALLFTISGLSFWRRGPGGSYEYARASRNLQITLGENTYRVETVTRWDRNGKAHIEDGRGSTLPGTDMPVPDYTAASKWMDIANVDFSVTPGDHEMLLVRVFDPGTQELLNWHDTGSVGYSLDGTTVQLRSLGRLLPDTVDVWFRVVNLPKSDPVWVLPCEEGASVALDAGGLVVRELRQGRWSYRLTTTRGQPSVIQWTPSEDSDDPDRTTVMLDWQFDGTSRLTRNEYFPYAVKKDGRRYVWDSPPSFLRPNHQTSWVLHLDVPLDEIDHFELRPFREFETRTTFYFEGVKLPRVSDAPFQPPPQIVVDVNGEEGTFESDALAPCRLKFQVERGKTRKGMFSNETRYWYTPASEPIQRRDTATTVLYDSKDLYLNDYALTLLDRDGGPIGKGGNTDSCTISLDSQFVAGYRTFDVPIEHIGQIRLTVNPPGEEEQ